MISNNPLRSELSKLERKLLLLISDYQKLKEELEVAKRGNEKLNNQLVKKELQISDFQNQNKINEIVNGMIVSDEVRATELSDMIDGYITEVDKCIAQLSE